MRLADEQSLIQAFSSIGTVLQLRWLWPKQQGYESWGMIPINKSVLASFCGAGTELVLEPAGRVALVACFTRSRHVRDPRGEAQGEAGGALVLPIGSGPRSLSAAEATRAAVIAFEPAALQRVAAAIAAVPPDPDRIPACFRSFPPHAEPIRGSAAALPAAAHRCLRRHRSRPAGATGPR